MAPRSQRFIPAHMGSLSLAFPFSSNCSAIVVFLALMLIRFDSRRCNHFFTHRTGKYRALPSARWLAQGPFSIVCNASTAHPEIRSLAKSSVVNEKEQDRGNRFNL